YIMPTWYEVVALATQEDWNKQNDLMYLLRPNCTRLGNVAGSGFLKLKHSTLRGIACIDCGGSISEGRICGDCEYKRIKRQIEGFAPGSGMLGKVKSFDEDLP